jgi:two-component system sporulation sensor kinase C
MEMISMDLIYLMANVETTGLLSVVLLYVYIYYLYRERYMGIFTTGWLLLFFRIVTSDSALNYKKSDIGFVIYVLLSIFACMLFLWGIVL